MDSRERGSKTTHVHIVGSNMAKTRKSQTQEQSLTAEEQAVVEIQAALERNGCELRAKVIFENGRTETSISVVRREQLNGAN